MASDHTIYSPTSTIPRTVLFLIFLLILSLINPTMAHYKDNIMSSRSEHEGLTMIMKRHVKEVTTRKQYGINIGNPKTLSTHHSASLMETNGVQFHPLSGQRRGSTKQPSHHRSPSRRPAFPGRSESNVFNASAHEVPSGPNPISNR